MRYRRRVIQSRVKDSELLFSRSESHRFRSGVTSNERILRRAPSTRLGVNVKERSSFTLVELLITITIIGILAAAVILVINPAQMLDQGRDARRIADLNSLNQAVATYIYQGPGLTGLGSQNTVYVSLSDTTTTCSDLSLPSLPTGWSYHCVTQQNLFNVNGTGWMPINLTQVTGGSPISTLLIDPTNSASGGEYYTYAVSASSTYELTAYFESNKYQSTAASDGGPNPIAYELGSSLTITPFLQGLVGYWPLNEGAGSNAYDNSGWNNNGTLEGATDLPTWTTTGCLHNGSCLNFDGSDDSVNLNSEPPFSNTSLSLTAWITFNKYTTEVFNNNQLFIRIDPQPESPYRISAFVKLSDSSVEPRASCASNEPTSTWEFIAAVWNGTTLYCYRNGVLEGSSSRSNGLISTTVTAQIGAGEQTVTNTNWWEGFISNLRLYRTPVTASQIQAIYNAEKPQ